jgi:hypothetical protein
MLMAEVRPGRQEVAMSGHAFQIKIDGRAYSGTYDVDRQVLTVKTSYGKSGRSDPAQGGTPDTCRAGPARARARGEGPQGLSDLALQHRERAGATMDSVGLSWRATDSYAHLAVIAAALVAERPDVMVVGSTAAVTALYAGDPSARGLRPVAWPGTGPSRAADAVPGGADVLWPVSTGVNTSKNDDPDILTPLCRRTAHGHRIATA